MRALVLEEIGRLEVRELPDPEPAGDDVVVGIAFTGICGSDIHGYTGENGRRVPGQVMGHESSGRILALGPDAEASGLRQGDPVTFNPVIVPREDVEAYRGREQHHPRKTVIGVAPDRVSGFAERVLVPLRNVVPLPASLPLEHGALVEPLAVALHAVRRGGIRAGDRVFVAGGGPIGQSIVLALAMEGVADPVVSEVSEVRRRLLEQLGARTVDPSGGDAAEAAAGILGGPADAAVDAVGLTPTVRDCLAATAPGGTVVLVGMGSPRLELDAYGISTAERTLVGTFTYTAADFADAVEGIAALGRDRVDALISEVVDLEQAPAAFASLAVGSDLAGKVLVRVGR